MSVHRYATPEYKRHLLATGKLPAYLERNPRRDYIERIVRASLSNIRPGDFRHHINERRWKSLVTGKRHVLDHIVPLNHPRVCGLNVPWNVQVIPADTNAKKSNHWCQWHGDLFDSVEQLNLL